MATLAEIVEADRKEKKMTVSAYVEHLGLASATGDSMTWSRIVGPAPRLRPVFVALKHVEASPELAAETLADLVARSVLGKITAQTITTIARSGESWEGFFANALGSRPDRPELTVIVREWFAMIRGEG
jgi:hypothetical protein